ncbi:MAG: deoxycytidylate deaminase [Bacilli bacterium]
MAISWDNYFMGVAILSGLRSKDPNTKVGACIVNDKKRIVGIGYNGFPRGCEDDQFPWEPSDNYSESKYAYVVHAELNAILNSSQKLDGCTIYVSHFPCNECAKAIIQSGITEVVYEFDKHEKLESTIASKKMFIASGIRLRVFNFTEISLKSNI